MTEQAHDSFDINDIGTFSKAMGIEFTSESRGRVEGHMPIADWMRQPAGFLHGGATITLLESLASRASDLIADHDKEYSFGVDVHVRHRKPGESGMLHGYAELDHEEAGRHGTKQFWNVAALDDAGDVVSSGVIMTKIVPKERLAEKQRERDAQRAERAQEPEGE